MTENMMEYIIKELKWKAESFKETGLVEVFNSGVVKSDVAIPQQLREDLKQAAAVFENVSKDEKDFHPGSDQKVVNLVHPSLFPVIFGRTRVLPDTVLGVEDCLDNAGQGEILPIPCEEEFADVGYPSQWLSDITLMSPKFQWLPCDVELTEDSHCRIMSYINNAHPVTHRDLYRVVEEILERVVPLWNESLTDKGSGQRRIKCNGVQRRDPTKPKPTWSGNKGPSYAEQKDTESNEEGESGNDEDEEEDLGEESNEDKREDEELDEDLYYQRLGEWEKSGPIILPEPDEFKPVCFPPGNRINLRENFPGTKLQVIVKLANIELTPEKRAYEGGSWHLEGSLVSNVAFLSFLRDTDHSRTSASAPRPSIIMTAKTSPKTHWPFANVEEVTLRTWVTPRTTTAFFKRFSVLALKSKAAMTRRSLRILGTFYVEKVVF